MKYISFENKIIVKVKSQNFTYSESFEGRENDNGAIKYNSFLNAKYFKSIIWTELLTFYKVIA